MRARRTRQARPQQDVHCWGEFLDSEWYRPTPTVAPHPEPWRNHRLSARAFLFSRELLEELAQPERLRDVAADVERIDMVRSSLVADGLHVPLEICIDSSGRVALRDGHHRLLASAGLDDYRTLPAFFTQSDGIRATSVPMMHVIERLLRSVEPP